jgi:hypothetical protein
MNPWVLFNPTNTAPMWNNDHQPHPEMWCPDYRDGTLCGGFAGLAQSTAAESTRGSCSFYRLKGAVR